MLQRCRIQYVPESVKGDSLKHVVVPVDETASGHEEAPIPHSTRIYPTQCSLQQRPVAVTSTPTPRNTHTHTHTHTHTCTHSPLIVSSQPRWKDAF